MKINVNLFTESGKWKYGGIVEVSGEHPLWSLRFLREVLANQNFVTNGTFEHYTVVITHRDDYDTDPSHYFCPAMWKLGSFVINE